MINYIIISNNVLNKSAYFSLLSSFASVKCVFEIQPIENSSSLEISDTRKTGPKSPNHKSWSSTYPPRKKRTGNLVGKLADWFQGTEKDNGGHFEDVMSAERPIMPHYTVAMSTVQKAFIDPDVVVDVCDDAAKEPGLNWYVCKI